MKKVKTTINIDSQLWKEFSHIIIEDIGYRKKNDVIEHLINEYVKRRKNRTDSNIIKAIILAAGIGSRLRPLTNDLPPCLLKINAITILEHQIKNLEECNIKEAIIVTGYKSEKIKKFLKENLKDYNLKFKFVYNKYYSTTSNLFSLWLAREYFEGGMVCLNSDIVFNVDILKTLLKSEEDICLAVDKKECVEEDMKVSVNNGVRKIGKRLEPAEVYGEFIGLSKFSENGARKLSQLLSNIPSDMRKKAYFALVIQKLIDAGHKVHDVEIQRMFWADIDFVEDLMETRAQIINKKWQ